MWLYGYQHMTRFITSPSASSIDLYFSDRQVHVYLTLFSIISAHYTLSDDTTRRHYMSVYLVELLNKAVDWIIPQINWSTLTSMKRWPRTDDGWAQWRLVTLTTLTEVECSHNDNHVRWQSHSSDDVFKCLQTNHHIKQLTNNLTFLARLMSCSLASVVCRRL